MNEQNNNANVLTGGVTCPECGGACHKQYDLWQVVAAGMLFPIGMLALLAPKMNRCLFCGNKDSKRNINIITIVACVTWYILVFRFLINI